MSDMQVISEGFPISDYLDQNDALECEVQMGMMGMIMI